MLEIRVGGKLAQNSQLLQLAQDPGTPLQTLQQLAQNYPGLRPAIALNPSTYPALLDWLRALGDPAVDAALAQRAQYLAAGYGVAPSPRPSAATPQALPGQVGPYSAGVEATAVLPGTPAGATSSASQTAQTTVFAAPQGAASPAGFPAGSPAGFPAPAGSPFAPVSAAATAGPGSLLDGAGTDDDDDSSGAGALPWVIGVLALILVGVIIYMAFTLFGPANRAVEQKPNPQATTSAPAAAAPTPQESEPASPSPTPTPSESGRPVPADALDLQAFYSPSGNIGCSLESEQVWCVLYKHNQTTSAGCAPDQSVVVSLDNQGRISEECAGADGELPTLDYGQTTANQNFACASAESGVECWHRATGRSFKLSREAIVKN